MPTRMDRCKCGQPVKVTASKGDTVPVVTACLACTPGNPAK